MGESGLRTILLFKKTSMFLIHSSNGSWELPLVVSLNLDVRRGRLLLAWTTSSLSSLPIISDVWHCTPLQRWELPVLCYPIIRVDYPYPFLETIFVWFCMILLDEITIKTVKLLPFFPHCGKLAYFFFKLPHFIFSYVLPIFLFPPKNRNNVLKPGKILQLLEYKFL